MYLDFSQMSSSDIYFAMTQTILPRPIAWLGAGEYMHFGEVVRLKPAV